MYNKLKKYIHYIVSKKKTTYNKIVNDEIPKEAAALTFITVLSFIPFLMLIFFVIPDIPGLDIQMYLQDLFLSILLPDSVEVGSEYVSRILDQRASLSLFNIVLLVITSFALFKFINSSFDKVLNARELVQKKLLFKISRFIGMILFGFIFIFVLFSSTSLSFITRIFDLPLIRNFSFIVIPFVLFFMVNSLIYFFATSIKIRIKSIVLGSVSASLIWIVAKLGFDYYIANWTNMEVVFGVISALPIFLLWIYLNWVIILLGLEFIASLEKDEINEAIQEKTITE